jgi:hypothetical protein
MQVVEDCSGSRQLEWLLDPETMTSFAEMLDHLADSGAPGHQYLVSHVSEELTVTAASDEYSANLQPG